MAPHWALGAAKRAPMSHVDTWSRHGLPLCVLEDLSFSGFSRFTDSCGRRFAGESLRSVPADLALVRPNTACIVRSSRRIVLDHLCAC